MDPQTLMASSGTHTTPLNNLKLLQFKICIFGGKAVGKTSFSVQYVESHFVESHYPTNVQNEFTKLIRYKNNEYTLEIVDTAGQDESSMVNMRSLMGCKGIILCYSVVSRPSFELVRLIWEKIVDQVGNDDIPVVIVANKIDLRDKTNTKYRPDQIVTRVEGEQLAEELSGTIKTNSNGNGNKIKFGFIETSAKLNINIEEAIMLSLKKMEQKATNSFDGDDSKCVLM
ncbi:hypothetical protein Kpol_1056p30 [Vanderwaltozyma polyspora DSM 70294]|uniref:Uncharacterized protein n=1 Tax=Vanderwaltozyma polyspora (strain ATCC 22028 / DSM 70294 / BCRC 21397 / CBS 2163 / NBRC 10782 / NRRL Y-8283 / UCD 57-17) TaxID=436907 RepID=A7TLN7_VANPO|nr:uncharacterized protein Kpol_1056p30 [Vanderwaltozyma polyspora DSM 70294]EDO16829.1 hypothetical protein Kpol_1056p30 [Vanderwaltozyma polyspora DSM 70294]